jgi:hypothetical protein
MKKNILLKIWPEIVDYIPATIPFSNLGVTSDKGRNLLLDFDNCRKVNSSGANILLIQLLKLMRMKEYERPWEFFPIQETSAIITLSKLGLFAKLNQYRPAMDLFWDSKYNSANDNGIVEDLNSGEIQQSYPIFSIKIDNEKSAARREVLLGQLRSWFYENFFSLSQEFTFNFANLVNIVTEIGKNTADHTDSDLFLGIDVIKDKAGNYAKIHFSIGDLGIGINNNIKANYQESRYNKRIQSTKDRRAHWDLTYAYLWALTTGNTTKVSSKANKGLGMASIIESSKKIPMELSIFDAQSRGLLSSLDSNQLSHKRVRKNFHTIGKAVGFYYYGEIFATKRGK